MAAITIVATAKSATANSYITRAAAQLYFDGRPYSDAWNHASGPNQDVALVGATVRLDQEKWQGLPKTTTQSLRWPRYGVDNADYSQGGGVFGAFGMSYGLSVTRYLDSDTIPVFLLNATCELALVLLEENRLQDTGLELLEQVGVGDLSVTPSKTRAAGRLPEHCYRFIQPYLIAGRGTVQLVRS